MILKEIIALLETWAPPAFQESYDNSKLLVGDIQKDISKVLITLDCTEDIVDEAIATHANLIIAHHPIIFSGLKSLTGKNYVERTIIKAIKNDIAIYAIHTNLDNVVSGVNAKMAEKLGLKNCQILSPKSALLRKLITYIPESDFENVSNAVFKSGAGYIGNYSHCGFSVAGEGSFQGNEKSNPTIGEVGQLEKVNERRFETVYPFNLENKILLALKSAHPYEEVAYDIYNLENSYAAVGSGMIGELENSMELASFLGLIKAQFALKTLKYSEYKKPIKTVAICGGAGSFLRWDAAAKGADAFISADFKYHEWFDADQGLAYIDIGHYESEQFTKELISEFLEKNAVSLPTQISRWNTNPIKYL